MHSEVQYMFLNISLNVGQKYWRMLQLGDHSTILSTFIKLPFVIKFFVLYLEWPYYTDFTVLIMWGVKWNTNQRHELWQQTSWISIWRNDRALICWIRNIETINEVSSDPLRTKLGIHVLSTCRMMWLCYREWCQVYIFLARQLDVVGHLWLKATPCCILSGSSLFVKV